MKNILVLTAAAASLLAVVPASADEVGVGVGVGPHGAGVTVGAAPDRYHEHDRTTVIKEREPRDKTVIIKKHREPEPDRKVIIDHDD
ncbi:hypothetical protein [Bradyrhizobium sp. SYSU BS000235]|uniref:hypothetical protein n=1 Tax=Bradyrhizobium sp. SYSU BS000235 TaxID=3411332 RepID=UPI003C72A179